MATGQYFACLVVDSDGIPDNCMHKRLLHYLQPSRYMLAVAAADRCVAALCKVDYSSNCHAFFACLSFNVVISTTGSSCCLYCCVAVTNVLQAHNSDVYQGSIQALAAGVSRGLNGTVFAYGATGSGKTHTMVGEYMAAATTATA